MGGRYDNKDDKESLVKKIEGSLKKPNALKRDDYKSDKRIGIFSYEGNTYSVLKPNRLSDLILYKARGKLEDRYNDGFSAIRYEETPLEHAIDMQKYLQERMEIPKNANYLLEGTRLEGKVLLSEVPDDIKDAVIYSKDSPKTLARYIGNKLADMHNYGIAYRDPSLHGVMVSDKKSMIAFNSLAFSQPIEKTEDKARDIMQFIISLHHNSGMSIEEITHYFRIGYNHRAATNGIKNAMRNVIAYDISHRTPGTTRRTYQRKVFGYGQDEMISLKKDIEEHYTT